MTSSEFDPNIPIGEPESSRAAGTFLPYSSPASPGDFNPDIPVGEPGGYQPLQPSSFAAPPMPTNSFDPNVSVSAPLARSGFGPEPAEPGIRFVARLIDAVVCVLLALVVAAVLQTVNGVVIWVLFGVVCFIYFAVFESVAGWTPGKKVLGLSVHGPRGAGKPTFGQAARRNSFLLWLLIPIAGLLIVLIPCIRIASTIFSSRTRQGRHDRRAGGTEVMKG